ncbi:MAG: hypothetical protein JW720_13335 [Sedimentisphaerales bacterium]|nr:hypothetical protein [Sedimentisphaerales bacterium]
MVSDDQPVRKKRRKLSGWYIVILGLLVVVGAVLLFRWRMKTALQKRIDAIRAAGYPVTCAELDKWYSIPKDVPNAAESILAAISLYVGPDEPNSIPVVGYAELPGRTEAFPSEMLEAVSAYISQNKEALDSMRKIAGFEHTRYPIDLSLGNNVMLYHAQDTRNMVRLLELEGIRHAEQGASEAAVESVKDIYGLACSLRAEPMLISQLVRIACEAVGVRAVERLVNRARLDETKLSELEGLLNKAQTESDLRRALAGERCMIFDAFEDPRKLGLQIIGQGGLKRVLLGLYRGAGLTTKGAIIYLDFAEEFMRVNELPENERIAAAKAVEKKLEQKSGIAILMVRMLVPGYRRVMEIHLRSIAQLRTASAGLAVERYRLAEGKLPEALNELVPEYLDVVPKDPFDGAELRFKRLEKGFMVYSIGEDCSDDGGKERDKEAGGNWDPGFIVER